MSPLTKAPTGLRRCLQFFTVGAMNAAIDVLVFNVLMAIDPVKTGWTLSAYNTVAAVCAILNSYVWNRRWTFADRAAGTRKERRWFWAQAMFNVCLNNYILVYTAMQLNAMHTLPVVVANNVAKVAAMFISSLASFLLMKWVVFRGSNQPAEGCVNNKQRPVCHPRGAGS